MNASLATVQCKMCGGSGTYEVATCAACHGSGAVVVVLGLSGGAMPCRACAGRSPIQTTACRACAGTGWAGAVELTIRRAMTPDAKQ